MSHDIGPPSHWFGSGIPRNMRSFKVKYVPCQLWMGWKPPKTGSGTHVATGSHPNIAWTCSLPVRWLRLRTYSSLGALTFGPRTACTQFGTDGCRSAFGSSPARQTVGKSAWRCAAIGSGHRRTRRHLRKMTNSLPVATKAWRQPWVITPFMTARGPTLQAFLCLHHHNPGCSVYCQLPFLQLSCNMVSRYAVHIIDRLCKLQIFHSTKQFNRRKTQHPTTTDTPDNSDATNFFKNGGPMFTKRSPRRMRYASAFLGYLRRAVSWPKNKFVTVCRSSMLLKIHLFGFWTHWRVEAWCQLDKRHFFSGCCFFFEVREHR